MKRVQTKPAKKFKLEPNSLMIVSRCTRCGSPIYGRAIIGPDEEPRKVVKRSCTCRLE